MRQDDPTGGGGEGSSDGSGTGSSGGSGTGSSGGGGTGGGGGSPFVPLPRHPLGFANPQPVDTRPWTVENPPLISAPIHRFDPQPIDIHPWTVDNPPFLSGPLAQPVEAPIPHAPLVSVAAAPVLGGDVKTGTDVNQPITGGGFDPVQTLLGLIASQYASAGISGGGSAPVVDFSQAAPSSSTSSSGGSKLFIVVVVVALLAFTWYRSRHKGGEHRAAA